MSWCSEWIRDWLRNGPRTQLELARIAGIDAGSVSRWLNGQSLPDSEVLKRFHGRLPDAEFANLLVAWLQDQLDDSLLPLVKITPAEGLDPDAGYRIKDPAKGEFHRFGAELREKLEFFGLLSIHNPAIRKILDVCYEAAIGRERA